MKVTCPHCGRKHQVNAAALLGATTSDAKAEAAKANGAKGGRPRTKCRVCGRHLVRAVEPNGICANCEDRTDANVIAHDVIAKAIKRTER